jgi:hypothetical protein
MTQLRVLMYADDTTIFVKPTREDMLALADLLTFFGEASGLKTKFQKSTIIPIRCEGLNLNNILAGSPTEVSCFPIKYLGLLLTVKCLKRVDFQPLVDKAISKLTLWNGCQINPAGRLTLVKAVLTSQAVYSLTSLRAPKETLKDIDQQRKKFLWAGAEALTRGKCKVNWPRSARPKYSGGLGILHLGKFARALRLRWLWLWRGWSTNSDRPWDGQEIPYDKVDKLLFAASTTLTIGNGERASFWKSAWLNGQRPCDVAPHLFSISRRKNRTLHQTLPANNWIRDIDLRHPSFSAQHFAEYTCL